MYEWTDMRDHATNRESWISFAAQRNGELITHLQLIRSWFHKISKKNKLDLTGSLFEILVFVLDVLTKMLGFLIIANA